MESSMVFDVIREAVGALAPGFVLLLALAGAVMVFRKSRAAGVFLLLAVLTLGFGLLLDVVMPAVLGFAQLGDEMVLMGWQLVRALIRGCGILMFLLAASLGPAPARPEEEY